MSRFSLFFLIVSIGLIASSFSSCDKNDVVNEKTLQELLEEMRPKVCTE